MLCCDIDSDSDSDVKKVSTSMQMMPEYDLAENVENSGPKC